MDALDVATRPAVPADLAFLFSTWLKSFRNASSVRAVPARVYYAGQHDKVAQLLANSTTLIAHPAGDEDTILGWVCGVAGQVPVIHGGYTKRTWRRLGVLKGLARALGCPLEGGGEFTHLFPEQPDFPGWTYNPFRAEGR